MDRNEIHTTMDSLCQLLDYTPPDRAAAGAKQAAMDLDHCARKPGGINVLLYGVPGSGKSWTIQQEYCSDESRMERLVFHPDYTYADFVGQILPSVSDDDKVRYRFAPGPFTRLLKKAYQNPDAEYFLIIEEINRGNAPAVFGEVFQLLDRTTENGLFPAGTSEYAITNAEIAAIVYGNPEHKVRIPSNMSIVGTMNTSDQNVFTLDTAFQRRWQMRLIENSFKDHPYADERILDTEVTWGTFCQAVNKEILDANVRMTSSEDKRLGAFFVSAADLRYDPAADDPGAGKAAHIAAKHQNSRFPEKVIKYLWDDAFRFSRENVFETGSYKCLEAVMKKFASEKGNDRFAIFKDGLFRAITGQSSGEE